MPAMKAMRAAPKRATPKAGRDNGLTAAHKLKEFLKQQDQKQQEQQAAQGSAEEDSSAESVASTQAFKKPAAASASSSGSAKRPAAARERRDRAKMRAFERAIKNGEVSTINMMMIIRRN